MDEFAIEEEPPSLRGDTLAITGPLADIPVEARLISAGLLGEDDEEEEDDA